MLIDGVSLTQGSVISAGSVEMGAVFPASPTDGRIFRLTVALPDYDPGQYWYSAANDKWITGDVSSVFASTGLLGGGGEGALTLALDLEFTDSRYALKTEAAQQSMTGFFPDSITVMTGVQRFYPRSAIEITTIVAWLSETSTSNITAAVRKNGIVVATITIPSGEILATLTVSIIALASDYITLDVVSGTGKNLTLRLDY